MCRQSQPENNGKALTCLDLMSKRRKQTAESKQTACVVEGTQWERRPLQGNSENLWPSGGDREETSPTSLSFSLLLVPSDYRCHLDTGTGYQAQSSWRTAVGMQGHLEQVQHTTSWGCVLTCKFHYLSGLIRPTGHEITSVGKIVGYTHRSLETGAMVHHARPHGKAPTLVMSRENCGQEPLLWLLQEAPGEAG